MTGKDNKHNAIESVIALMELTYADAVVEHTKRLEAEIIRVGWRAE